MSCSFASEEIGMWTYERFDQGTWFFSERFQTMAVFFPCSFYCNILKYFCCDLVNIRNLIGSASSLSRQLLLCASPSQMTTITWMIDVLVRVLGSDPDWADWERGEDTGRRDGTHGVDFLYFPIPSLRQALVHRASDTECHWSLFNLLIQSGD